MSLFGAGKVAAAALRARVLERIGAEPEWTAGEDDADVIGWTSGPATTFFCVEDGPDEASDLGVFRVFTPVATVGDEAAAHELCGRLNTYATTSQWIIAPGPAEGADAELLRLDCSFVVGPHNRAALESFVTWCVREQIATATAQVAAGLPDKVGGEPWLPNQPSAPSREQGDPHEVVRQYRRAVESGADTAADDLAVHLQRAFLRLREEMEEEGTGAWFSPEPESCPLSCEMPANWFGYGDDIRWGGEAAGGPPTAQVNASLTTWGDLGNGLLITMWVPAARAASVRDLNRLGEQARGATHFVGAWAPLQDDAAYLIFLPAALLGQDIDWPVVMREILLTFARQAQLARRVIFDDESVRAMFGSGPAGLEASLKPHGLAWGETGEGRNPVARYLGMMVESLVGQDAQWAYPAENGFTWWPFQQAQTITALPRDPVGPIREIVRIRVVTNVRDKVAATPEALIAIAARNASLPESALVLRDDGTLVLACQLVMTESLASGAREWVRDLAIRQLVAARELSAELAGLGEDAVSAHPVSGPRPEPSAWFERYEDLPGQAADGKRDDMPESRPAVALIAAGGQYALPYRMAARDDGTLEFSWRPEHTYYIVPADPEVRVTATPGADVAGPAWIIRSHLPVTGDATDKARWCNDRNAELLLAPDPPMDLMMTGGWGLSPEGGCCLIAAQMRRLVRNDEAEAARAVGYLLREVQSAVVAALRAAPQAVRDTPLTTAELAAGLGTVREAFGRILGERPDLAWTTQLAEAGVQVTCGDLTVEVPTGYGRPQLALVFGALLASSPGGESWQALFPLLEDAEVADRAVENLERDGILWQDESGDWVFDAGCAQARLELTRMGGALRVDGVADFLAADRIGALPAKPGTGRLGATIPPAQFAWAMDYAGAEVLEWTARRVIGQVRDAARQAEGSRTRELPGRPRLFGSGRLAATALRARLLELLGAEQEWMLGEHDSPGIVWNSGLATTVFEVSEGAPATPDLGVLRVYTPVAAAGNGNAARDVCLELNAHTGTARWSVAREQDSDGHYADEVQVGCAFVVGPHNQDALESFALWCVREQIATATTHIRSGAIAEAVSGVFTRYGGFPAGDDRADLHPVTSFTERVVQPSASLSADVLAQELLAAFRQLREAMFGERTDLWFAYHDDVPLTCETPFSWDSYPQNVITRMRISDDDPQDKPGTALLESEVIEHPDLGNGLRVTVHVPRDPRGHVGRAINDLNRLDIGAAGATHSFGGWTISTTVATGDSAAPGCEIFLPAAFGESVTSRPLVMREILLTLARQALLARRVLLPRELRSAEDRDPEVGLAVAADPFATLVRGPHGLAWGETGEGRNPAARVLDEIYAKCVGPDGDWADTRADGFTWWPYQQAQDITATLRSASDAVQGVSIRIATQVRRGVPVTEEALRAVAAINGELGQGALVLDAGGSLYLACRLYVHEGIDHWANEWAKDLAAEQFITAREISARLADAGGFGADAVSGHPFSGMRPVPDELFGVREAALIPAAHGVQAGLSPLVPLLGLGRLYALPLEMPAADSEGGVDFTWRLSQTRADLPVDVAARVCVQRGDIGSGPGWIVRSFLPVAGDEAARARWCNDQNTVHLADGDDSGGDLTFVGAWGLAPDGQCCLTTWLSPFFVPDTVLLAAGLVGNVLSYQAGAVRSAVNADPGAVTGASTLRPEELAGGLSTVLACFARALEYPADFRWAVTPDADGATVTLTGPSAVAGDVAEATLSEVALAEAGESALRSVLHIPLARNRAQLGLLYAAFLGRAVTRVRTSAGAIIPGEIWDWDFTFRHIEDGLGVLDDEGLLDWHKSERAFAFDAGPATAWLRFGRLEQFRSYGGTALRLTATVPDASMVALPQERDGDGDLLDSWCQDRAGVSYEVTIPPAGMFFGSDVVVCETLTWLGRHVIDRMQNAVQRALAMGSSSGQAPEYSQAGASADVSWHDHGDGTAAIMSGTELVASFNERFLAADNYPVDPPPDRSEDTRRNVQESSASLATSDRGERELESWVARKWMTQLDSWWMYGEPVFWCEHIEPDDDEQPLLEWFMHFPMAVGCDQCADRIRAAMRAGMGTVLCHSCGREAAEATFGRTPGLSIIANYELCPACVTSFNTAPRATSLPPGEPSASAS